MIQLTPTKESNLMEFIEYLESRGLINKSTHDFDYEKVIWDFKKQNK